MNRAELVEEVAKVTCTKKEADVAISAALAAIQKALKKGDSVTLVGFGTFSVSKRKARKGRNPQTGEAIKIAAKAKEGPTGPVGIAGPVGTVGVKTDGLCEAPNATAANLPPPSPAIQPAINPVDQRPGKKDPHRRRDRSDRQRHENLLPHQRAQ